MKKTEAKNILLRVPMPLLRRLNAAAKSSGRTRAAEMRLRLAESLKKEKSEVVA